MQETNDNNNFFIDTHVHSSKYSECAESLDPRQIEIYSKKAGIHGIVMTEHDTLWRYDLFHELQKEFSSILFFNGIEITSKEHSHLVLIGLKDIGLLCKGIPANDAINIAHEQGGVAILAHPFRNGLPPLNIIDKIDAVEIASTSLSRRESELSQYLAQKLNKPSIACSDAHSLSRIGWAYTQFPEQPESTEHLCRMIKEGQGRPVIPNAFFS